MANQDFDINIRVNANTAQVEAIRNSFEKLGAQVKVTNAEMAGSTTGGFGGVGSAVGIGTIVSLLTGAINKWSAYQDELDKTAESMIKATEKSHALGLAVADMLEAMKSAERINTEPLQFSFDRLTQKVIELKTEMKLAFETGDYEAVKKYAAALGVAESQLDRVTSSMDKQAAAADRLAKAKEKALEQELSAQRQFNQEALGASSPQAQAILRNEEAARRAEAQGGSGALFQRTADTLRKTATPDQLSEYEQLAKVLNPPEKSGTPAGIGESQAIVDAIEKNRADFQKMIDAQKALAEKWQ